MGSSIHQRAESCASAKLEVTMEKQVAMAFGMKNFIDRIIYAVNRGQAIFLGTVEVIRVRQDEDLIEAIAFSVGAIAHGEVGRHTRTASPERARTVPAPD